MIGNASFSIPIQSACRNVLLGLYWFSESVRCVCVCINDGRGTRQIWVCSWVLRLGNQVQSWPRSARSAPALVFTLLIFLMLKKFKRMWALYAQDFTDIQQEAIPVPGILICIWTREQRREGIKRQLWMQSRNRTLLSGLVWTWHRQWFSVPFNGIGSSGRA